MRSERRSKNSESQPQKSRLKPADYFPFSFHLFSDFYWSVRGIGFSLYRCWVAVVLVVSMGYLSSRIFHAGHYVDLMVTEQNWRFLFSPNNKTRLSSEWAQQQTIQPRNMQMKQIFSMVKTQEMLQFSLMQRSSSFFMLMLFQCAPPRLPQTWSILTIFCNNSQTYYLSLARSFFWCWLKIWPPGS